MTVRRRLDERGQCLLEFRDIGSLQVDPVSRGAPYSAPYAASKHAVEGLTKAAALDGAAAGVRVNAIAPGPVQTAMLDRLTGTEDNKAASLRNVPLQRAGQPREIADAVLFASSESASFITGADHPRQRRQDRLPTPPTRDPERAWYSPTADDDATFASNELLLKPWRMRTPRVAHGRVDN